MSPAPKNTRRWFQFGIGTMLVTVTVVAAWLGFELKAIRDRRVAKAWLADHRTVVISATDEREWFANNPTLLDVATESDLPPTEISFWRRWLGDETIAKVYVGGKVDAEVRENAAIAQAAFPEADVYFSVPCAVPGWAGLQFERFSPSQHR